MSDARDLPPLPPVTLAPGRSCGGCTMCCKLPAIKELDKPANQWCVNCDIGVGCKIYETRPTVCAAYFCQYRIDAAVPEIWKPDDCRMVMHYEIDNNRFVVQVDQSRRDAWKKPPYYPQLKAWAKKMLEQGGLLIIWQAPSVTVVLPDRDVDLGPIQPDHVYLTTRTPTPQGLHYDVQSVHKDDPRVKR